MDLENSFATVLISTRGSVNTKNSKSFAGKGLYINIFQQKIHAYFCSGVRYKNGSPLLSELSNKVIIYTDVDFFL